MKKTLRRSAYVVAAAAFALTALLIAAGSRLSYASSTTTKSLAVLFTNDTLGYLESCG